MASLLQDYCTIIVSLVEMALIDAFIDIFKKYMRYTQQLKIHTQIQQYVQFCTFFLVLFGAVPNKEKAWKGIGKHLSRPSLPSLVDTVPF